MEYSWKIENVDDVTNTMTVKYTFNVSYPLESVLVNMSRCPAGVNVTDHIRQHAPTNILAPGGLYNNSAITGSQGIDSVYVDSIVKMDSISLVDYKKLKLEELAAKRFEYETGGFEFNGIKVDTSRQSQATLGNAYVSMKNGLISSVDWKDSNGNFVTLTLDQIEPLSVAVAEFVQLAFSKEKSLAQLVDIATTKSQVDLVVW